MNAPSKEEIYALLDLQVRKQDSAEDPGYKSLRVMPLAKGEPLYEEHLAIFLQLNTERWGPLLTQLDDILGNDDWPITSGKLASVFGLLFHGGGSDEEEEFSRVCDQVEWAVVDFIHDRMAELMQPLEPDLSVEIPALDFDDLDELWSTGRLNP